MAAAARPTCTLHRRVSPCMRSSSPAAACSLSCARRGDRRSLHSQSILLVKKKKKGLHITHDSLGDHLQQARATGNDKTTSDDAPIRCREEQLLHSRRFGRLQEVDSFGTALPGSDTPQSQSALALCACRRQHTDLLIFLSPNIKQFLTYTSCRASPRRQIIAIYEYSEGRHD